MTGSSGGAKLRRPMAGHRQHVPEFLAIGTAARCRRAVLSSVAGSDDLCCLFVPYRLYSIPTQRISPAHAVFLFPRRPERDAVLAALSFRERRSWAASFDSARRMLSTNSVIP